MTTLTHIPKARYAISSTNPRERDGEMCNSELFWNYRAWYAGNPDHLLTHEAATVELARLQESLPHDKTLTIVDYIERIDLARELSGLFQAECDNNGYSILTHEERKQPHAKALRASALEKAKEAQREKYSTKIVNSD